MRQALLILAKSMILGAGSSVLFALGRHLVGTFAFGLCFIFSPLRFDIPMLPIPIIKRSGSGARQMRQEVAPKHGSGPKSAANRLTEL